MNDFQLPPDVAAKLRRRRLAYDERAFVFVLAGIEYLQSRLPERRHVTGAELAQACREFAMEQFGLLAREVLDHWGIRETADFGRIVYALVDVGLLVTQPGDRIEDFENVYSFERVFDDGYPWGGARELGS
ncbi:MAG: Minf_1886 family protein [Gemmatimonadales bacterium]